MSISCGFFNSLNHDRAYDATDMSSIFDGIINDGIYASIGSCFAITTLQLNTVMVGPGRAWFNKTWTYNDAPLPITLEEAEVLLDRIDAVVLEVNSDQTVRANDIKVIKGTPAATPIRPAIIDEGFIHQHALAYIYRPAQSTEITQSNITNMVGSEETPFVTGILRTTSITELLGQWESDLDEFVSEQKDAINKFISDNESDFSNWYNNMKQMLEDTSSEMQSWMSAKQNEINTWFDSIKGQLEGDVATSLSMAVLEINNILSNGTVNNSNKLGDKDASEYISQCEEITSWNNIQKTGFFKSLPSSTSGAPDSTSSWCGFAIYTDDDHVSIYVTSIDTDDAKWYTKKKKTDKTWTYWNCVSDKGNAATVCGYGFSVVDNLPSGHETNNVIYFIPRS